MAKTLKTGNQAIAEAMRQIEPDVVAAYPITPATEIVETFSKFVADGLVKTEFVPVESEHSAMSAVIGAAAAGGRAMTASASQGVALMHELLYIAPALRLPVLMAVANRALSAPINIHCDHSDTMGFRDAGWLQFYSENPQEAYDNFIQAIKICEKVKLPAVVAMDGFITSHELAVIKTLSDRKVKDFIGSYKAERSLLDFSHPYTLGALDLDDYYFEHKYQAAQAMSRAPSAIKEVAAEWRKCSGRSYDFFDEVSVRDANTVIVALNSVCGTIKTAIKVLKNAKVGLIKLRVFRPFPHQELADALSGVKTVIVMDRSEPMNDFGGPVFNEVRSALYDTKKKPKIVNCIYGLGGRNVGIGDIKEMLEKAEDLPLKTYLGLRK